MSSVVLIGKKDRNGTIEQLLASSSQSAKCRAIQMLSDAEMSHKKDWKFYLKAIGLILISLLILTLLVFLGCWFGIKIANSNTNPRFRQIQHVLESDQETTKNSSVNCPNATVIEPTDLPVNAVMQPTRLSTSGFINESTPSSEDARTLPTDLWNEVYIEPFQIIRQKAVSPQ